MEYKTKTSQVALQVETSTDNLKHLVDLAKKAGLITPGEAKCYLRDITVLHFTATF